MKIDQEFKDLISQMKSNLACSRLSKISCIKAASDQTSLHFSTNTTWDEKQSRSAKTGEKLRTEPFKKCCTPEADDVFIYRKDQALT